jgi:hypothetical protein
VELDELHVGHGNPRATPWRCRRRWRCPGWWCTDRPCRHRPWPARCRVAQVGAGDLGVFVMRGDRIAGVYHGRDPALGPAAGTVFNLAFAYQCDPVGVGQAQRQRLPGQAAAKNQYIVMVQRGVPEAAEFAGGVMLFLSRPRLQLSLRKSWRRGAELLRRGLSQSGQEVPEASAIIAPPSERLEHGRSR